MEHRAVKDCPTIQNKTTRLASKCREKCKVFESERVIKVSEAGLWSALPNETHIKTTRLAPCESQNQVVLYED